MWMSLGLAGLAMNFRQAESWGSAQSFPADQPSLEQCVVLSSRERLAGRDLAQEHGCLRVPKIPKDRGKIRPYSLYPQVGLRKRTMGWRQFLRLW